MMAGKLLRVADQPQHEVVEVRDDFQFLRHGTLTK